ncbi:MAG: hypothetical protein ACR2RV_05035 [Verrucomicrobiales bacterium]
MARPRTFLALALSTALLPACTTTGGDKPPPADHPLGSGSVKFFGFDQRELQEDFLVIPEEGAALIPPVADATIEAVDGFWWRGSRQWFKIPDHCHTTIQKTAAGMRSMPQCSQLGTRLQKLRGGVTQPGWVDDAGATRHGTDYPFSARAN